MRKPYSTRSTSGKHVTKERYEKAKKVMTMITDSMPKTTSESLKTMVLNIAKLDWSITTINTIKNSKDYEEYKANLVKNAQKYLTKDTSSSLPERKTNEEVYELKVIQLLTEIRDILKQVVN